MIQSTVTSNQGTPDQGTPDQGTVFTFAYC